jgi:hypothetical protein
MSHWNKVKAVSFRVQEAVEVAYGPVYKLTSRNFQATRKEHKKHDFELGLGPCGETVRELYYREDSQGFQVYQVTERSRKNFVYPWSELHGRITVTYLLQTETLPL